MAKPRGNEGQHRRSLHGCLAKYVQCPVSQEEWAEVREQAWVFAIREKEAALAAEAGSPVRLSPKDEEELTEAMEQIHQGEYVEVEDLLRELRSQKPRRGDRF